MLLPYDTDKGYEDLVLETATISHTHDYDNGGAIYSHHPKAAIHEDMPTGSSLAQV